MFTPTHRYPVGTMLFQSLGSMIVGLECILRFTPDVYCDTMGAAFTYPVVHYLSGAKVVAYVHYPIISTVSLRVDVYCASFVLWCTWCCVLSGVLCCVVWCCVVLVTFVFLRSLLLDINPLTHAGHSLLHILTNTIDLILPQDMLKKVRDQRPSFNNASTIASSVTISSIKLQYYQLFARVYSWVGQHAQVVMVNSTWTKGHVEKLWWCSSGASGGSCGDGRGGSGSGGKRRLSLVYPPCNTTELLAMPFNSDKTSTITTTNIEPTTTTSSDVITVHTNKRIILSIAQFRPEKDHMLQIKSMRKLVDMAEEQG